MFLQSPRFPFLNCVYPGFWVLVILLCVQLVLAQEG